VAGAIPPVEDGHEFPVRGAGSVEVVVAFGEMTA